METIIRTDNSYYIKDNKIIWLKQSKCSNAWISFENFNKFNEK